HIILDRSLAEAYHFPAINILKSVSRSAIEISGAVSRKAEGFIRKNMAAYAEVEDMINIGAYKSGSNPSVDTAIAHHQPIEDFLVQDINETASLTGTLSQMAKITGIAIPEDEMLDRDAHPHDAVPAPHGASGVSSQAGLHGAGASSSPLFAGRVFSGGGLASFPGNIDIIDSTGNSA
ncbi:MAG: hypothetical protein FWF29_02950, partial [Treponema sp.]|nr:hypothetical protein [Treponema sp.]